MAYSEVRSVIFDLDGVLIDSLGVMEVTYHSACRAILRGQNYPPFSEYCKYLGRSLQGIPMLGVISRFDPFTGNLRFCWLSVAHTVMQVSWTSDQTYSRALRTDFIPAMCPCALLVLMSAYAGTG